MTLEVLEPSVIKRFDGLMRSVAPGSLTKISGSAREASEAEYGQARLREAGKRRTREANSSWNALIQVLASPPDVLVPEEYASSHFFLHSFPNFSRSLTVFEVRRSSPRRVCATLQLWRWILGSLHIGCVLLAVLGLQERLNTELMHSGKWARF